MNQDEFFQKLQLAQALLGECLENIPAPKKQRVAAKRISPTRSSTKEINFSQGERPFFKNNINKKMNGQKKFTFVVAYLAKGKLNKKIKLVEVENTWKKAKKFITTGFHSEYGTRAKDDEYLDSPKQGVYILTSKWKNILY